MTAKQVPAQYLALDKLITDAETILVLQPDSPDGDSIGSALGLEEVLADMGKTVVMYSYKEIEPYLQIHEGWDRVSQNFPKHFDMTILVDTGSPRLIKEALAHNSMAILAKPMVVIDHHTSRQDFGFPTIDIVEEAVATAELLADMCLIMGWTINSSAATKLARALLSDSLNLTTSGTTARSVKMLAALVERGANLHDIYRVHREVSALSPEQLHLKGRLLSSIQFELDGQLAIAEIPPEVVADNINKFEPYNMIIGDMQWAKGVKMSAVFKNYGTKINVPLRSADGIAGPIAELMGGGGHANAAAYRCETTDIPAEKDRLIAVVSDYLHQQSKEAVED